MDKYKKINAIAALLSTSHNDPQRIARHIVDNDPIAQKTIWPMISSDKELASKIKNILAQTAQLKENTMKLTKKLIKKLVMESLEESPVGGSPEVVSSMTTTNPMDNHGENGTFEELSDGSFRLMDKQGNEVTLSPEEMEKLVAQYEESKSYEGGQDTPDDLHGMEEGYKADRKKAHTKIDPHTDDPVLRRALRNTTSSGNEKADVGRSYSRGHAGRGGDDGDGPKNENIAEEHIKEGRVTKSGLQKIIKEEYKKLLKESEPGDAGYDKYGRRIKSTFSGMPRNLPTDTGNVELDALGYQSMNFPGLNKELIQASEHIKSGGTLDNLPDELKKKLTHSFLFKTFLPYAQKQGKK